MTLSVNGIELYYETVGSGEPLLLVHGNGEDHTIFAEAVQLLRQRFTCYLIDSRDHGQSSRVEELSYIDMADDILELMDGLGLDKVHFYGFSDGGIVGLIAASMQPQRFKTLMVSGANLHPRGLKDGFYYKMKAKSLWKRDEKLRLMLQQPNITAAQLRRIRARTLVLAGQNDLIKELHTRTIARLVPQAVLKILPGEDHGSYIVHSEKIARLILAFAGGKSAAGV